MDHDLWFGKVLFFCKKFNEIDSLINCVLTSRAMMNRLDEEHYVVENKLKDNNNFFPMGAAKVTQHTGSKLSSFLFDNRVAPYLRS